MYLQGTSSSSLITHIRHTHHLQGLSKASIGLVVHAGCVDEGGGTASEEGRWEKAIIPYHMIPPVPYY